MAPTESPMARVVKVVWAAIKNRWGGKICICTGRVGAGVGEGRRGDNYEKSLPMHANVPMRPFSMPAACHPSACLAHVRCRAVKKQTPDTSHSQRVVNAEVEEAAQWCTIRHWHGDLRVTTAVRQKWHEALRGMKWGEGQG